MAFDPVSMGLMLGGSALGGIFGKGSAANARSDQRYRVNAFFQNYILPSLYAGQSGQMAGLNKLQDIIEKGYGRTRAEFGKYGRAQEQQIKDLGTQQLADVTSGLAKQGLARTSKASNLKRAVYSGQARQKQGLNQMLAELYGGLSQSETGALAGVQEARTGAQAQHGADLANIYQNYMQAFMGGNPGAAAVQGASNLGGGIGLLASQFFKPNPGGSPFGSGFGAGFGYDPFQNVDKVFGSLPFG